MRTRLATNRSWWSAVGGDACCAEVALCVRGAEVFGAVLGVVEVPVGSGGNARAAACAVDGSASVDESLPPGSLALVFCSVSALLSGAACPVSGSGVGGAATGAVWDWCGAVGFGAGVFRSGHAHLPACGTVPRCCAPLALLWRLG